MSFFRNPYYVSVGSIAVSIVLSIWVYPRMPEVMASHWNIAGEVDGYMPKFWALSLMPIVSIVMLILFWFIPKIDPMKKNIELFRIQYERFVLLLILFLLYVHGVSIVWNVGYRFDMGATLAPALGILFMYIGTLLKYSKRNWFIGIRTPWTLSSDSVWDKTHRLGSRLFQVVGASMFVGMLFPNILFIVVLGGAVGSALVTVVYSYMLYKKEQGTIDS